MWYNINIMTKKIKKLLKRVHKTSTFTTHENKQVLADKVKQLEADVSELKRLVEQDIHPIQQKEPDIAEMMGANDGMAKKLQDFGKKNKEVSFQIDQIQHPWVPIEATVPNVVHEVVEDLAFVSEDIRLDWIAPALTLIDKIKQRMRTYLHAYEKRRDMDGDNFIPTFKLNTSPKKNDWIVLSLGWNYFLGVSPELNRFTLIDPTQKGHYVPIAPSIYVSGNEKWDEDEDWFKKVELPLYDYAHHTYFIKNIYDYLLKNKFLTWQ